MRPHAIDLQDLVALHFLARRACLAAQAGDAPAFRDQAWRNPGGSYGLYLLFQYGLNKAVNDIADAYMCARPTNTI